MQKWKVFKHPPSDPPAARSGTHWRPTLVLIFAYLPVTVRLSPPAPYCSLPKPFSHPSYCPRFLLKYVSSACSQQQLKKNFQIISNLLMLIGYSGSKKKFCFCNNSRSASNTICHALLIIFACIH